MLLMDIDMSGNLTSLHLSSKQINENVPACSFTEASANLSVYVREADNDGPAWQEGG